MKTFEARRIIITGLSIASVALVMVAFSNTYLTLMLSFGLLKGKGALDHIRIDKTLHIDKYCIMTENDNTCIQL